MLKCRTDYLCYWLIKRFQDSFDYDFKEFVIKYIERSNLTENDNTIIIGKSNITDFSKTTNTTYNTQITFNIEILSKNLDYKKAFDNIEHAKIIILSILLNNKELQYRKIRFTGDTSYWNESSKLKLTRLNFTCNDTLDSSIIKKEDLYLLDIDETDYEVI